MTALSDEVKQAQKEFIQQIFEEVKEFVHTVGFYRFTFHIFATLGLHMIVKEEDLLNRKEYDNLKTHNLLLKRIKEFLEKYIK
ncbi:MAG: hypothetical protein ACFFCE_10970 [Promethearchaeota archaeon]